MKAKTLTIILIIVALTIGLIQVVIAEDVDQSGNGITPVFVEDNPTCSDLGLGDFELKIDLGESGNYNGTWNLVDDGVNSVTLTSGDDIYFDWTSSIGIDAVLAKGSNGANVYLYDPESTGDTNLHPPVNASGGPAGISHINFCYDYEVEVTKTADTSYTRTWEWDITKEVDPDSLAMFAGESGTVEYTISLDKTGFTDSDWSVAGIISVYNPSPHSATVTSITDSMTGGIVASVNCDGDVALLDDSYDLGAFETLTCSYSSALPDASDRVNTAVAETEGIVGGDEGTADVTFGDPTTEVDAEVNVNDTNGKSWGPVGDDSSWTYEETFSCSSDINEYTNGTYGYGHENVATIVETEQSDDAYVTIDCYAPVVSKTATTSFNRYWTWSIDKSADQSELLLSLGQTFQFVNYTVSVTPTYTDDDHAVAGTITVVNPHPSATMEVTLADMLSDGTIATLNCNSTLTVSAGSSATCDYTAGLSDDSARVNTATATLNDIAFTGTADVTFSDTPNDNIDECVDVNDTHTPEGFLGTVCNDSANMSFEYQLEIGPYYVCGDYTIDNTADFVANDSGATGESTWTVDVNVPCVGGCSLTQGYWKTHSSYGPAPYDDTWAQIGEDTLFFKSGQSYYEVLWTAPQGNAYYNLAHQYIAAELNGFNGADTSVISDDMAQALLLFETYTPTDVANMKSKSDKETRAQFIALNGTLDAYNNGEIGPGHCSE